MRHYFKDLSWFTAKQTYCAQKFITMYKMQCCRSFNQSLVQFDRNLFFALPLRFLQNRLNKQTP